jgi:hypothetical protein
MLILIRSKLMTGYSGILEDVLAQVRSKSVLQVEKLPPLKISP